MKAEVPNPTQSINIESGCYFSVQDFRCLVLYPDVFCDLVFRLWPILLWSTLSVSRYPTRSTDFPCFPLCGSWQFSSAAPLIE